MPIQSWLRSYISQSVSKLYSSCFYFKSDLPLYNRGDLSEAPMEAIQSEKDFSKETAETESSIYEYDPWLLDDHPLRSYPTECIPGLGTYLDESCGKRNKAFLRVACVLIGFLAAFQLIRFLPIHTKSLPHIESPYTSGDACTFPTLDTRPEALNSSLAVGCNGLRTTVGMSDGELQIGNVVAASGLDPLLTHIGQASPDVSSKEVEMASGAQSDLSETFLLMLDAKTPLRDLYPHLIEQLDTFRQRGYLSHWNGDTLVQRAVVVVVTGETSPNSDCVNHSYADLFWAPSPERRVTPHTFTGEGLRHLSPICTI